MDMFLIWNLYYITNAYEIFRKYRPGQKVNLKLSKSAYDFFWWRASKACSIIFGIIFTLGIIKSFGTLILASYIYNFDKIR